MRNKIYFLISFVLLFNINIAFSQNIKDTINIKEVTINSERLSSSLAYKKVIIDTIVMQTYINSSLSELLSEKSSIYIKSYGQGSMASSSFRGTKSTHTKVAWNGVDINSPMLGQIDFSLVPVSFIDEITINFGANSTDKFSGALGGSINLKNKANWNENFSLKLSQSAGSFDTYNSIVNIAYKKKSFNTKTKLYYQSSKNNFSFTNKVLYNHEFTEIRENAEYLQKGILQEFYYRQNNSIMSLRFWLQNNSRNIPKPIVVADAHREEKQSNDFARTVFEWRNNNIQFLSAFIFEKMYYQSNYINTDIGANNSLNKSYSYDNKLNYEYDINQRFKLKFGISNKFVKIETNNYEKQTTRNYLSFYVNFISNISSRLLMSLLVKQDVADKKYTPIIPTLGVNYKILKNPEIILKANVSRNYNMPTLNDLYWFPGGNPELENEKGLTGEIALLFNRKSNNKNISVEITSFYTKITDWIIWQPSDYYYWKAKNIKEVSSYGFESTVKQNYIINKTNIDFNISYIYNAAKNTKTEDELDNSMNKQLIYSPIHQINTNLRIIYNKFSIINSVHYIGKRYTQTDNLNSTPAYIINDIDLIYRFVFGKSILGVQLKLNNLFNKYYESIQYYPMPGRNFHISLVYRFVK